MMKIADGPVSALSKPRLLVLELWGLGDLVIATPFLRAAAAQYDVTLLAKPFAHDLRPRLWPDVRVISFVAPWTAFDHKYRLWRWPWGQISEVLRTSRQPYDLGVSARWDPRDHLLLFWLRARQRLGFSRLGSRCLLTHTFRPPNPASHAFEYWKLLAEKLGFKLGALAENPTRAEQREILLHTGAGQAVRVWPLDRYRHLAEHLRRNGYSVQIACDVEQQYWWTAAGEAGVAAPRSVSELAALVDRAWAFVGNDSGPGHLAACLGVPTFTLFGPQLSSRFAPLHRAAEWLEGKPCKYKPCLDACRYSAPHCLWDLSSDEVWSRLQAFANRNRPASMPLQPRSTDRIRYPTRTPRRFIQLFCRYLQRGGEEASVGRIARHLELGGHQVIRFWRASAEWTGAGRPPLWGQVLRAWNNHAVLARLRETHRRFQPDAWILHNIIPVISLGVYRLALELNVPIIRWIHNHRPISPSGTMFAGGHLLHPEDRWLAWKEVWHGTWHGHMATAGLALGYARLWQRGDFESVKAWVAISEEMREVFLRAGYPPERLHCLHHSWDIHPPIDLNLDQGYFLFLGRMVEEKGVRFLVELFQRPEFKRRKLIMAGEGILMDELRKQTAPNIRWAGFVEGDEKRRLVAGCRAMLLPSVAPEALGLVAYEAYEQAKPVLGSALGGVKELILDGKTGRLLPPADASAWSAAIAEQAENAKLSRQWGLRGLQWLQQHASVDAWNDRFHQILEQALASNGTENRSRAC